MGERKRSHGDDEQEEAEEEEPTKPATKKSRTSSATIATNRNNESSSSSSLPHRVPTNTQTDIQKIIRALSEYARGTNNSYNNIITTTTATATTATTTATTTTSNETATTATTSIPSQLEPIPKVLVGLIGSHCEVDPGGVAEAARGIVEFCGCGTTTNNRWLSLRFIHNRGTILRNEFRSVLSSGGIEIVLSALHRIVPKVFLPTSHQTIHNDYNNTNYNNTTNNTSVDASAKKEAIYHCWGVIKAGVVAGGLSKTTLLSVVGECLFALHHEMDLEDDVDTNSDTVQMNAKILWTVLGVLSETLARTELTTHDLFYYNEHVTSRPYAAVFAACLAQLAKACSCGTTTDLTNGSQLILAVIGETLGVFVACARKGLIAGSDYQRLIPACRASLARYEMELADYTTNANNNANSNNNTILVRIVELMEAEDKTVGLWLRHTYGIPPSTSHHQQQQEQHQEQQQPPPPRESTRRGDGGVPPLPDIDHDSPPRMAAPIPSWPCVLVAEPDDDDDDTSDEDEVNFNDDDDDDDEYGETLDDEFS